jgi:hypothetical protein
MLQKFIFEIKLEKTLSEKDKSICDDEITVTKRWASTWDNIFKSTFKCDIGLKLSNNNGSPFLNSNASKRLYRF